MKIEEIIYQTTRGMHGIEDRLKIASIFLFCEQLGSEKLAELLYCLDKKQFISDLEKEYESWGIDLKINFDNPDVLRAFNLTVDEVVKKEDSNGFLKAIFEKDPFALAICEIVNFDFNRNNAYNIKQEIDWQLKLF